MNRPTETTRLLRETDRRTSAAVGGSTSALGSQASGSISAGTTVSGAWVRYGRVGITAISDGFRVRSTQIYGRVGITPISDGFRVKEA